MTDSNYIVRQLKRKELPMQYNVEKMVTALFPDAIPGKDFMVQIVDGKAVITSWNSIKLGFNPGIEKIHEMYMKYVQKRKSIIPTFDDSDPLPYLSQKKVRVAVETPEKQRTEIFNGLAFTKVQ
jgi:hypothetical protein